MSEKERTAADVPKETLLAKRMREAIERAKLYRNKDNRGSKK